NDAAQEREKSVGGGELRAVDPARKIFRCEAEPGGRCCADAEAEGRYQAEARKRCVAGDVDLAAETDQMRADRQRRGVDIGRDCGSASLIEERNLRIGHKIRSQEDAFARVSSACEYRLADVAAYTKFIVQARRYGEVPRADEEVQTVGVAHERSLIERPIYVGAEILFGRVLIDEFEAMLRR